MASTMFMRVDEVAEELGVSVPYAYKLIRSMNAELKKTGCITIQAGSTANSSTKNFMPQEARTKGAINLWQRLRTRPTALVRPVPLYGLERRAPAEVKAWLCHQKGGPGVGARVPYAETGRRKYDLREFRTTL